VILSAAFFVTWLPVTVIFLLILGVLVFAHEFGHFIAAKKSGIGVEEFGFGFPPRLFGIRRKETTYSLNLIPLGGFVRLVGESGPPFDTKNSFAAKPPGIRFLVLVMGVVMNLVLAILVLAIGFGLGMPLFSNHDTQLPYPGVKKSEVRIVEVLSNSLAQKIGLEAGDIILGSPENNFYSYKAIYNYSRESQNPVLRIKRGESEISFSFDQIKEGEYLGILMQEKASYSFWWLPFIALCEAGKLIWAIMLLFGKLFADLFAHGIVPQDMAGPVGIFIFTSEAVRSGFFEVIRLIVVLSINLAIINILPFPALDGGRILFVAVEKLRGRRVAQNIENIIHSIGLVLLLVLIFLITWRDIIRLK